MADAPIYTRQEIGSYLPPGWSLADGESLGSWDGDRWTLRVRDAAESERRLSVSGEEVRRLGRLEALRAAAHGLHRRSLG